MSQHFCHCSQTVRRLYSAVLELERATGLLKLGPLQGREWFDVLRQKLLPQLVDEAFLVVAVVGGTNIGKSVIFNRIARSRASATSPLASGTKHPVCLVPRGFAERHDLGSIFEGFQVLRWTSSDAPLEEHPVHRLYWHTCDDMPENLLVLDTPDIDSDAPVNWERAHHVRRCADVLIAVLTQQKYNDAAVKQFFRQAAAEDKGVIVIFNQCELPEDESYWPLWLETFCRETHVQPEFVYIAPSDRRAAEENRLPFYERTGPRQVEETDSGNSVRDAQNREPIPRNLTEDLSRLRFGEIKLRSLRGSLRHLLDPERGVPAYLTEVERRSNEFLTAAERLSADSMVKVRDWPSVPNKLLVNQIRQWWRGQQTGWVRGVHGFYDAVGHGVSWPFLFVRDRIRGPQTSPWEAYQSREWTAILHLVDELFEKLTWMSESSHDLLKPHLERLLAGRSRAELLTTLKAAHEQAEFEQELEAVVEREMESFQSGSPELYRFYRQLSQVSVVARPVTSVVLFTLGWGPAGHVVAPFVADAAAHAVVPVIADFAGGTAAALAGESALASAAGQTAGYLQAKFQRLQGSFTARRAEWLVAVLKNRLFGSLPDQLQAAAHLPASQAFQDVRTLLVRLDNELNVPHEESVPQSCPPSN